MRQPLMRTSSICSATRLTCVRPFQWSGSTPGGIERPSRASGASKVRGMLCDQRRGGIAREGRWAVVEGGGLVNAVLWYLSRDRVSLLAAIAGLAILFALRPSRYLE